MSASSKKVLIRCDAAPEIGFGHVVRCLALADELRNSHGCQVDFAMLQGPQGVAQVQDQGYAVFQPSQGIEDLDEGAWLQDLITGNHHQVLVLDVRTDLANEAVQSIRESGVVIVTIDDPSDRRLHADLAFYPPVPQVDRMDWNGFTGERFVGWGWVLLQPQFAEAATRAHAKAKELKAKPLKGNLQLTILVTMGGSDPAGLTLMALQAVDKLNGDFRVFVVIGGGFMHESALQELLNTSIRNYKIFRNVTDMASLMDEANLAVTSFGVTAYELAVMNVPTINLCLTEDHAESASAFVSAGLGSSLGHYAGITFDTLSDEIEQALILILANQFFSENHKHFPDGLGSVRIANSICGTLSESHQGDLTA